MPCARSPSTTTTGCSASTGTAPAPCSSSIPTGPRASAGRDTHRSRPAVSRRRRHGGRSRTGRAAVLDGVIAVLDTQGRPDLAALGRRLAAGPALAARASGGVSRLRRAPPRRTPGHRLDARAAARGARRHSPAAATCSRCPTTFAGGGARSPSRGGRAGPPRTARAARGARHTVRGSRHPIASASRSPSRPPASSPASSSADSAHPASSSASRWRATRLRRAGGRSARQGRRSLAARQQRRSLTVGAAPLDGVQPLDATWLRPALTATVRHQGEGPAARSSAPRCSRCATTSTRGGACAGRRSPRPRDVAAGAGVRADVDRSTPARRRRTPAPAAGMTGAVLMCRPDHFGIEYEINPWMHVAVQVDHPAGAGAVGGAAPHLRRTSASTSSSPTPVAGLPDMVFTANAAVALGRTRRAQQLPPRGASRRGAALACGARAAALRGPRAAPVAVVRGRRRCALRRRSPLLRVRVPDRPGSRTGPWRRILEVEVVSLELVDPRFYHLDTCFCPLDATTVHRRAGGFLAGIGAADPSAWSRTSSRSRPRSRRALPATRCRSADRWSPR